MWKTSRVFQQMFYLSLIPLHKHGLLTQLPAIHVWPASLRRLSHALKHINNMVTEPEKAAARERTDHAVSYLKVFSWKKGLERHQKQIP